MRVMFFYSDFLLDILLLQLFQEEVKSISQLASKCLILMCGNMEGYKYGNIQAKKTLRTNTYPNYHNSSFLILEIWLWIYKTCYQSLRSSIIRLIFEILSKQAHVQEVLGLTA